VHLFLQQVVTINPDGSQLPGTSQLQGLANGVGFWALIAAAVGVVVGGIMWAFGHYAHNYQQAFSGRRGVIVSGLAALLVGGAGPIISFFLKVGKGIS
jgi:type IV secretory pathway VirB2 component (pilin)